MSVFCDPTYRPERLPQIQHTAHVRCVEIFGAATKADGTPPALTRHDRLKPAAQKSNREYQTYERDTKCSDKIHSGCSVHDWESRLDSSRLANSPRQSR